MAYLPLNLFFFGAFMLGVVWGWEGDEMRQLFAVISSIFMLPLWTFPLFSISQASTTAISIVSTPGWLPTFMLENILFWNVVLMYWTGIHLMETLGREEPIGKALKRARKQR